MSTVAKSIKDAIIKGIVNNSGRLDDVASSIEGEIRDYLAHEMMKFLGKTPSGEVETAMHQFFKEMMREHL